MKLRFFPIFSKRVKGNLQGQTNQGFGGSTASLNTEKEICEQSAILQVYRRKQIIEKQRLLIDDKNKEIETLTSIKEENEAAIFVGRQQNALILHENKESARSTATLQEEIKELTMKSREQIKTYESFVIKLQEENRALKSSKGKLQSIANRLKLERKILLAKEKENIVFKAKCVQIGRHNKIILTNKRSNPSSQTSESTSTSCRRRKTVTSKKFRPAFTSAGQKCDDRTASWASSATHVMLTDQVEMREMEHKQVDEFRQNRRYHHGEKKPNKVAGRAGGVKRLEKPSIGVVYEAIRDWTSTCKNQGRQMLCPTAVPVSFQKLVVALRELCGDRPDNLLNHLSMSPTDIPPGLQGGDTATIFCHTLQVWLVKQIVDESVPTAPPVKLMEILKTL